MEGPNWASELATASLLAFQQLDELDSDAQIKRGTRFRDTPLRQTNRRRLAEVEEDTPEAFEKRKQLVGLLVESISLGRSHQDGHATVQITYRFGPPDSASEPNASFVPHFKNGNLS